LDVAVEEQMDEDVTSSVLLAYSFVGWSVSLDSFCTTEVISTKSLVSFDTEYAALTCAVSSGELLLQIPITPSCSCNEGMETCGDVALTQLLVDSALLHISVTPSCSCNEGMEMCGDVALTQLLVDSVLSYMSNLENKFLFVAILCLSNILSKERRSKGTSATETENIVLNSSINFVQIASLIHGNSERSAIL
jgi:hypothetical protein